MGGDGSAQYESFCNAHLKIFDRNRGFAKSGFLDNAGGAEQCHALLYDVEFSHDMLDGRVHFIDQMKKTRSSSSCEHRVVEHLLELHGSFDDVFRNDVIRCNQLTILHILFSAKLSQDHTVLEGNQTGFNKKLTNSRQWSGAVCN